MPKYNLSIFAYFRNEAPYLKEWIEFHRRVGVEHFFLVNNLSTDKWRSVINPYRDAGIVSLKNWKKKNGLTFNEAQRAYGDGTLCKHFQLKKDSFNFFDIKNKTKWLAMIDIDEFLYTSCGGHLPDLLEQYGPVGGIAVNRFNYGSRVSGRSSLVTSRFLHRERNDVALNRAVKTIANMKYYIGPAGKSGSHVSLFEPGFPTVDVSGEIVSPFCGKATKLTVDGIRINHYYVKTKLEFNSTKKARRRMKHIAGGRVRIGDKDFSRLNTNDVFDKTAKIIWKK